MSPNSAACVSLRKGARVRLAGVLGALLQLSDAVNASNYGDAAALSSAFFDLVGQEAAVADRAETKQVLEEILQGRDQLTAALVRADPAVVNSVWQHQLLLRKGLGFPAPVAKAF